MSITHTSSLMLTSLALLTGTVRANDRFELASVQLAGDQPVAIATGDVNGDGNLDVVRAERDTHLHLSLGDGTGALGPELVLGGTGDVRDVELVDIDVDGDLDIVAVDASAPASILIYFNDGAGVFSVSTSTPLNHGSDSFALGDVDEDGDPDACVCDYFGMRVLVYENDGAGGFVAGQDLALPYRTHRVELADIDNDGSRDVIALCEQGSSDAYTFLNDGTGTFGPRNDVPTGVANHAEFVADDWTGEGIIDLAIGSRDGLSILHGTGGGGFSIAYLLDRPNWNPPLASGDFDGDQRPDLALQLVAPAPNPGSLVILSYEASTGWEIEEEHAIGSTGGWGAVCATDLDGDGFPDLLAAQRDELRHFSHTALDCDDNGRFDPEEIADDAALDLDQDGVLDVCESVQRYCVASPNTAGAGALMGHNGSTSLSQNAFTLEVSAAPPLQPGVFYFGDFAQDPPVPFGNGWRCAGGNTVRLNPPIGIDAGGQTSRALDFSSADFAAFGAGDTAYFQFWYRDQPQVGTTFNLSDALAVRLLP
ncbi:MAG: hypothetical protein ACI841_002619 [Planctomycetota bacterium]|jgi:hypothetical protein